MDVNDYFQKTCGHPKGMDQPGTAAQNRFILRFSPPEIAEVSQFLNQREGFEVIDGEVWHNVTPELLGWMERQIQQQLIRAPRYWQGDLSTASLFFSARDASGITPAYRPGWCPPEGLPARLGFEDTDPSASRGDRGDRPAEGRCPLPAGLAVGRSVVVGQPIDQITRTITAGSRFDVSSIYRDGLGRNMIDLSRNGIRLVCGVSPDRITL